MDVAAARGAADVMVCAPSHHWHPSEFRLAEGVEAGFLACSHSSPIWIYNSGHWTRNGHRRNPFHLLAVPATELPSGFGAKSVTTRSQPRSLDLLRRAVIMRVLGSLVDKLRAQATPCLLLGTHRTPGGPIGVVVDTIRLSSSGSDSGGVAGTSMQYR